MQNHIDVINILGPRLDSAGNCCGGAEHVHPSGDHCVAPARENRLDSDNSVVFEEIQWVPWYKVFHSTNWAGIFFSFLIYITSSVVLASIAALLVHKISPEAKGSGIPEVKAGVSGFWIMKSFSGKTLLIKALGSAAPR